MYGSVRGAARKGRPYRDRGMYCVCCPLFSNDRNDPRGEPKAPG